MKNAWTERIEHLESVNRAMRYCLEERERIILKLIEENRILIEKLNERGEKDETYTGAVEG